MSSELAPNYLVKTFVYKGNYYVYDTQTNTLLQILKEHFIVLERFLKKGFPTNTDKLALSNYEKDIVMLQQRGMFKNSIVEKVENPYLNSVESFLKGSVHDMTLQVTRQCNFDCRYCLYAGEEHIEREHENKNMSIATAYKSIDFLFDHSYDAEKINISFYGGEPLLNFKLIKSCVKYAEKKFYSKQIEFSMTVNGSLLDEEKIMFFIEHDFKLSISLDGPEVIQDSHRKFRNTGEGTFGVVMKNITYIRDNYSDFFNNNLEFMPVVMDNENYEIVSSFFEKIGVKKAKLSPLKANLNGVDYYLSSASHIDNSSLKFIDRESPGINDTAFISLKRIYDNKKCISSTWHHNGQCIPGIQRIFVDCDGVFYPCEKIIENETLQIGNVQTGFNLSKIKEMLCIGKLLEDRCKKCWAMRFCEICVSLCLDVDRNQFSKDMKVIACKAQENNALWLFKKLIDKSN